jgi:hypothetical protein
METVSKNVVILFIRKHKDNQQCSFCFLIDVWVVCGKRYVNDLTLREYIGTLNEI